MDKIELLFNKLNALLEILSVLAKKHILSRIPRPILHFIFSLINIITWPFKKTKFLLKTFWQKLKTFIATKTKYIRSNELKEKTNGKINKLKDGAKNNFTKTGIKALFVTMAVNWKKLGAWVQQLSPKVILSGVVFTTFLGISGIQIFFSGNRMYNAAFGRRPASGPDISAMKPRAKYHKRAEKMVSMEGLTLPIYAKNKAGDLTRLLFDFNIQLSNRQLAYIFKMKEHEIKSYINENLQQFEPHFLFTPEGKRVVQDKVRLEINNYFKQKNNEGQVDQVYINNIIGG